MSDKKFEVERIRLEDLPKLDDTDKVVLRANEALVVHELRQVLVRQAERDLIIEELRAVVDTLSVGHVLAVEEIKRLKYAQGVLLRQQQELHERQDIISAVCDSFAEKLEKETEARERLVTEISDKD